MKVVVVMGSKKDAAHSKKICAFVKRFKVRCELHVASAHKQTQKVLGLARKEKDCVFVAVAGRSNALGGVLDGNSSCPVINCPPYSKKYKGLDVLSSLRMPSRIACSTVLEPENAGLAALKILALKDAKLKKKLKAFLKA